MQSHSRVVDAVFGGGAAALVQFLRSDSFLARGYRVIIGVELRWPNLAKESTMRKFTVSFRMRILWQCRTGLISSVIREACFGCPLQVIEVHEISDRPNK